MFCYKNETAKRGNTILLAVTWILSALAPVLYASAAEGNELDKKTRDKIIAMGTDPARELPFGPETFLRALDGNKLDDILNLPLDVFEGEGRKASDWHEDDKKMIDLKDFFVEAASLLAEDVKNINRLAF